MDLRLYNTLTRSLETFEPIDPEDIRVYICGVTPYDDSHIGHARSAVVFDVLFRLLRATFDVVHVTLVKNFTDIDDKIITRAKELGEEPIVLAARYIDSYHDDMDALNVILPTSEPKVSENLQEIVEMIDELIAKDFAYVTPSGDVMYRVSKFPRFGELARRNLAEEEHGARVAVDAEKEAPEDFVLWKADAKSATKMEMAFHPSEYGAKGFDAPGRPGWHIECSAMSKRYLGETFDIHGGGEDLLFPHHSCEIAQSEALLKKGAQMAKYWMHNGFITVEGKKMSKSLGNFTTIKDAFGKFTPESIRYWLLQTHYRKPVDYSDEALHAAQNALKKLQEECRGFVAGGEPDERILDKFYADLFNDLNTAEALSVMWSFLKKDRDPSVKGATLLAMDEILGLGLDEFIGKAVEIPDDVTMLIQARDGARKAKDWKESDRLRLEIEARGYIVEDSAEGTKIKSA